MKNENIFKNVITKNSSMCGIKHKTYTLYIYYIYIMYTLHIHNIYITVNKILLISYMNKI
jgi:hypothetical protein